MKPSRFNVYRRRGLTVWIFNAFGGWAPFDPASAALIQAGRVERLNGTARARAAMIEALVPDELDELSRFRSLYQEALYDTNQLVVIPFLTMRCNLACPYCFEEGAASRERMSDASVERLLVAVKRKAEMDRTKALRVLLFGGEPLLEVDKGVRILGALSRWARRRGIEFRGEMSTNGVLVSESRVKPLLPYLDGVQVTFDGPRRVHDQLRIPPSGAPTYRKVLKAIDFFTAHDVSVHVRVQAHSADDAAELLRDVAGEGVVDRPGVEFSLAVRQRFTHRNCEHQSTLIDPTSKAAREIVTISSSLLPRRIATVQLLPCVTVGNLYCVLPNLDLYKCITSTLDPRRRVGRISEDGQMQLGRAYASFLARDPTTFPECRECALLPLCGGGCPTQAFREHGSFAHAWCGQNQAILNQRIDNAIDSGPQAY